MKWFGRSWGAPICEPASRTSTPGGGCNRCGADFLPTDQGFVVPAYRAGGGPPDEAAYHLRCFLKCLGLTKVEFLDKPP